MNTISRFLLCVIAIALPCQAESSDVFSNTCNPSPKPYGLCDPALVNLERLKHPQFTVEPDRVIFQVIVSSLRTNGTVVGHYGYEPDKLDHTTARVRYEAPTGSTFPVQIDSLIPGRTIFHQWEHLDDKGGSEKTEILNFDLPAFVLEKNDPCPKLVNGDGWGEVWPGVIRRDVGIATSVTPGHGTAVRVNAHHALVCSGTVLAPGGLSFPLPASTDGQLYCPKDFPRNLSASSTTITVPKLGPITFDGNIQYWRESVDLRFNSWVIGLNASSAGQLKPQVVEGWHKWSAANWNPHDVRARYWIWCSNSPDPT